MNYTDFILVGFVILGLILGLIRGWWRTFIGLAIFAIGMVIFLQSGISDYVAKFVRYDLIEWLISHNWIQPIQIDMTESLGVVFELKTVEEAVLLLQNFDLDPNYLILNASFLCKFAATFVVSIIMLPVAFLLSAILYWLLIRWITPKFFRKGFIPRIAGIFVGGFGYIVIGIIVISVVFSPLQGVENNIINPLKDTSSNLYQAISTLLPDQIGQITNFINNYSGIIDNMNPLSTTSQLCRPLINTLDSMGLNPLYIISETIKETGEKVNFQYAFDYFLKDVTDAITSKVLGSNGTV